MNFLNPWFLFAALVALVPLIIHLLHRQRARIEVFPSLEFLRKMMRKRTRRFRLKQILLLVIRTLLMLVIALALARPTLTRGKAVRGHLPTTAVIILDDSFSMSRREGPQTLFEAALDRTARLLRQFDASDQVYLLTASSPSRDLSSLWSTHDAERLRGRLGEVECTDFITDLAAPLGEAADLIARSADPNKEIHIVSDMQKIGWEGVASVQGAAAAAGGAGAASGKALLVDLGEQSPNACVADLGFRIPAGSDDLEMDITFARSNSRESQGRVAETFFKGTLLGRSVFNPAEGDRETETLRLPAFQNYGWGEVVLAEDNLPVDDKRYFALPSRRRTVGLAGDTYYIAKALSPEGGGSLTLVEIGEGGITRDKLSGLDILIMSDVPRLSPLEVADLSDFVAGGGGLLIFLGNRIDQGDYNRNLIPRLVGPGAEPRTQAGEVGIEGPVSGTEASFFTIDRFDKGHRIFAKFKPDASPFSDAHFYTFMKIARDGAKAVASFSDGSPALLELSDHVMVFASSADVAWSDFVLTPQFLPILHETLLYMTSGMPLSQAYPMGEEIVLKAARGAGEASLEGPAGALSLFPEAVGSAMGYRIAPPEEPGIYFLKSGEDTISVFAVNVDARESDLTKITPAEAQAKLKGFETRQVGPGDSIEESVSLLRRGRDLSRTLLWAGLILLAAETLLASTFSLRFSKPEGEDALQDS